MGGPYGISLITGDGIGPEISEAVLAVLGALGGRGPALSVERLEAGDGALERTGSALPRGTLEAVRRSDACLKAPVGESAADVVVALRRKLDLYASVRPARSYPHMPALRDGIDMVIVRENTEDLYAGNEFEAGGARRAAVALRIITERASERIARYAFGEARRRGGKMRVTCVHKANVMRLTDGLFAGACAAVAAEYPDVAFDQMYVDACAMNLVRRPESFDVIVTTNLFGDILSDESSQVAGGLGAAPAANVGDRFAMFEPVHGAAFDIAGRQEANPASFILSAAMMLRWLSHSRGDAECAAAAGRIERAVHGAMADGIKTADVGGDRSTSEFAEAVAGRLGGAPV